MPRAIRFRVRRGDAVVQEVVSARRLITIGSGNVAALRVQGEGVDRVHAVIDCGEVMDLCGATRINGEPVARRRLVTGDRIGVGELEIDVEVGWTPDGVETALIAALADGDTAALVVYADWLEECGDHARAELLRLEAQLVALRIDPARRALAERQSELARTVDDEWLLRVVPRLGARLAAAPSRESVEWDLPEQLRYLYAERD